MSLTVTSGGRVVSAAKRSEQAGNGKPASRKNAAVRVTDRVEWSSALFPAAEKKSVLDLLRPEEKKEKSSLESVTDFMNEQAKIRRLCARIAARIRAGDQVPPQDRRYLKRRDPLQYLMATLMQKPNEDPKRCGSLLKNKDKQQPAASAPVVCAAGGTAGETAAASASAAAGESGSVQA